MAIKVELNPFFVEDAEGRTSFEMDCPTVGKCLKELVKRYPPPSWRNSSTGGGAAELCGDLRQRRINPSGGAPSR